MYQGGGTVHLILLSAVSLYTYAEYLDVGWWSCISSLTMYTRGWVYVPYLFTRGSENTGGVQSIETHDTLKQAVTTAKTKENLFRCLVLVPNKILMCQFPSFRRTPLTGIEERKMMVVGVGEVL